MEGYLEKQSSENPFLWKGRWFVMNDSKLFYYKSQSDVRDKVFNDATVCGVIELADIDSVTTAKDFGVATFQIRTQSRRYILRAESKDRVWEEFTYIRTMHDWLFNFQKSIANIISVLTRNQSMTRAHRSVSYDYQESMDVYAASSSVMDDFYRGRASGGFFFGSDSFSDGSSSNGEYPTQQRTSPRRATSPMSFSSFHGPRSPLATMFAFDPLDDVPEVPAIREEYHEETKGDESDDDNDDLVTMRSNSGVLSGLDSSPALLQTLSPPVATGKWVPRFLRNRSSATPAAPPPEDYPSSSPPASSEAMPAPTPGRWVPPNQREGFVSSSSARNSLDLSSFGAVPQSNNTRESFSDTLFFEDTDSYSIGDDVHGVTSLIGVRKSMEDVCSCIPDLNAHFGESGWHQKQSIYMLFDGHSGVRAAKFSEQRLLSYLRAHEAFMMDARSAFEECFQQIDTEFLEIAANESLSDGTTAAVVLIRGNRLLTANIGDSRAVASIGGQALDIIEEQTPGRVDERERIESRGGWVREERELHMSKLHSMDLSDPEIQQRAGRVVQWVNIFRVNGELAVSRAIGDIDYKGESLSNYEYWAFPEGHDREFHGDLIIAVPEFQEIEITPEFEFLILACDGLWDTITSKEAVRHVAARLNEGYSAQVR
ncbi:Protein phosphatase, partial [Globisporangium splendens]